MRTICRNLPQKPGGQAPKPALPLPPHSCTGHTTRDLRLPTAGQRGAHGVWMRGRQREWKAHRRSQELGHGKVAIRLGVSWLVTCGRGGMPQPCLQSPAEHSCPAWHHLLCQVLSHLTFHLTFITYNSYVYSHVHCTGDTKAQEAKGPAQAQIAWG